MACLLKSAQPSDELKLSDLRNIGPAALKDFAQLGIGSVAQLQTCAADELFTRLQIITGQKHDPCVWDVFAAAIHQAKTGEAKNWWTFTAERKRQQVGGNFPK